jgi:RimJ/RimL family protein N-acetyltransferase
MTVLESKRMIFRRHKATDFEAFCAMEADPEVRRFVGGKPRTREAAERKFRDVHLKATDPQLGLMATIFKPEERYIGYCGLYPNFDAAGGVIEREAALGLTLARAYWGQGLATEAGAAFVRFGFGQRALNRIVSTVEIGNAASMRVLEKLGFVVIATEAGGRSFYKLELRRPDDAVVDGSR